VPSPGTKKKRVIAKAEARMSENISTVNIKGGWLERSFRVGRQTNFGHFGEAQGICRGEKGYQRKRRSSGGAEDRQVTSGKREPEVLTKR